MNRVTPLLAWSLNGFFLLSLSACTEQTPFPQGADTGATAADSEGDAIADSPGQASDQADGNATPGLEEPGLEELGSEGPAPDSASSERTSAELVASWSLGWNLGNSLDAPEGETAWGNPVVNANLLQAVSDAGFDVVRIPVTWSLHTGAGPDFLIEQEWMTRVKEVVGYALDAELHVILNIHHDGADGYEGVEWLTLNDDAGAVTDANNMAVRDRFVKLWTQIADHFADYGEQLLFESMNEIHDGYGAPQNAYYEIINHLNQDFVDTIREAGGHNPQRHLVIPGYNTNIEYTVAGFVAPNDSTPNHLILSAHFYDPYTFAIEGSTNTWGAASPSPDNWGQESHVVAQFDLLKTNYVDAGLPVVLGEYGAVHQTGFEDYRRYYMEYVTAAATERQIVPIYWDNGGMNSGADGFGLFDRTSGAVTRQAIVDAMLRASSDSATLASVAPPTP